MGGRQLEMHPKNTARFIVVCFDWFYEITKYMCSDNQGNHEDTYINSSSFSVYASCYLGCYVIGHSQIKLLPGSADIHIHVTIII